ncbi:MAG: AI-2E family transporter [bacterium]
MIPTQISRNPWFQTAVAVSLSLALLWFGYLIRDILMLFLLAFFFAYVLDPAVDWVEENLSVGRITSVIILLTVITILTFILGYFLTSQLIDATQKIAETDPNLQKVTTWIKSFLPGPLAERFQLFVNQLETEKFVDFQRIANYIQQNLSSVSNTLQQGSFVILGFARQTLGIIGVIVNVVVLIFSTIYFLKDFDHMIETMRKLIPHYMRPTADELFKEVDEMLRAFFRGHLIVCVTIGILYGTGYLLVGLEGGFLIGFLSGLMNVIPYIGPSIGFLLASGLGLYQFGLGLRIGGIVLVFVLVQSLEGNILTPNIVGGAAGLNPVTVIFALLVFGKFFGFIGLLIAIPCAGILKVFLLRLYRYYRSTDFYRTPPK